MAKRRKIELTIIERLKHFKLPIFFFIGFLIQNLTYMMNYENPKFKFLLIYSIISFSISLYYYLKQTKRLFFFSFTTSTSDYNFKKLVEGVTMELDCTRKSISKNKVRLFRPDFLNGGEDIFILRADNKIYINSIKPIHHSSSYSKKRNKENIITVLRNIENLIKGDNLNEQIRLRKEKKEIEFWNESDWTTKKILMRLIMYPFTISVLAMFFFLLARIYSDIVNSSIDYGLIIVGLLVVTFFLFISWLYLSTDIKILFTKRQLKQKKLIK